MRIGIVHGSFKMSGGSEKVAASIIKILKKNDHTIDLYFGNDTKDELIRKTFGNLLDGITVHKIFQFNIPIFSIYRNLVNIILVRRKANKDKNDMIIETSGVLIPGWFTKKPYLIYCNGINVDERHNTRSPSWKSCYEYVYNKIISRLYNKVKNITIISNSQHTKELIKIELNIDSIIIYPPVELDIFNYENGKKKSRIIMVGRISPEKNLKYAIDVLNQLNVESIIFGNSKPSDMEYLRNLEKLVRPNVNLMVNRSRDFLIDGLRNSKVFFHTGKESLGIAIIEAIAAGCIPIVPNNTAHNETVPNSELRYKFEDIEGAQSKLEAALNGRYDYLIPELTMHIKQFDESVFHKKILGVIEQAQKKILDG